jgi:hypothetical protein
VSSSLRSRGLQVDDPVQPARRPSATVGGHAPPGRPSAPQDAARNIPQDAPRSIPQNVPQSVAQEWRDWSPATGATSFRFPPELLRELADRADRTGLPQGQIALAGITALLDQDDEQVVELCDRAARALRAGRRKQAAKRRKTSR